MTVSVVGIVVSPELDDLAVTVETDDVGVLVVPFLAFGEGYLLAHNGRSARTLPKYLPLLPLPVDFPSTQAHGWSPPPKTLRTS